MSSEFDWMTHGLEFYKQYFCETRHPSSKEESGLLKRDFDPKKTGLSPKSPLAKKESLSHGEVIKRILIIFTGNDGTALKISRIHTLVNQKYDETGKLTRADRASYNTVKKSVYKLKKYGLIKRLPHHYYKLRDREKAIKYLEGNRAPLKGPHPDNGDPFQKADEKAETGQPLPDTKRPVKVVFHKVQFSKVIVPVEVFKKLLKAGRLKRQKGNSRSRQWKYSGDTCKLFISEKSYSAWGILEKKGWEEEITLNFSHEVAAQIPNRITTHCAIEDSDDEFSFITNNNKQRMRMTFDKGSQTFGDEYEFEGPLDQVNTAKMFFIDPVGSVNKLSQLEETYSYMAQCQGNLVAFATGTKYSLMELKEKVSHIENTVCARNEKEGGVDYHR